LNYDHLVFALGCVTNFYDIPNLAETATQMKTLETPSACATALLFQAVHKLFARLFQSSGHPGRFQGAYRRSSRILHEWRIPLRLYDFVSGHPPSTEFAIGSRLYQKPAQAFRTGIG
jgi:hypothetical protein